MCEKDETNNLSNTQDGSISYESNSKFKRKIELMLNEYTIIEKFEFNEKHKTVDFKFTYKNVDYFIRTKFRKKGISIQTQTFREISDFMKDKKGECWLIQNTRLALLTLAHIEYFNNENSDAKIRSIQIVNGDELNLVLRELFNR